MFSNILQELGQFSERDTTLFNTYVTSRHVKKQALILKQGEVCQSAFYIISGSFFQYQEGDIEEEIIDLHLEKEWMFNHTSLIGQSPSGTSIQAFTTAEVMELRLSSLHELIGKSNAFLQLGRLFNQGSARTYLFDQALSPAEKYSYIQQVKPLIAKTFPVKMIASYLKMAPETLSRVRASY